MISSPEFDIFLAGLFLIFFIYFPYLCGYLFLQGTIMVRLILGVTAARRRSRNCSINFLVLYIYIYIYVGISVFGVVECILRLWAMLKGWRCCSKGIKTKD